MKKEEKELCYKSVYFDLPYLIFVKDGFKDKSLEDWAKAYSEGREELPYSQYAPHSNEPSFFSIGGGFPVYIPPEELATAYIVRLDSKKLVGVQFLRRINQSSTTKMCGEVPGDRTGRASFSSIRVNFDLKIFDKENYDDMNYICNLALNAVNKFIEHYRVIAERFYIRPVTPAVIQTFLIFNSFTDGSSTTQTYGTGSGPMHGLGGAIEEEKDKALRAILVTQSDAPIIETINLEIIDKLDLREWRLAIIESAVLFETWINIFLRQAFVKLGLDEKEIESKFVKKDKNKTPLTSYFMAKNLVLEATGYDFGVTPEFHSWSQLTKDVRNLIVHGKKFVTTSDEAQKAYSSVVKAINVIKENTT